MKFSPLQEMKGLLIRSIESQSLYMWKEICPLDSCEPALGHVRPIMLQYK
jgi:hypothetical protein